MSKNHFMSVLSLAAGLSCASVFAADFGTEGGKEPGVPGTPPASGVSASISWEELKDRCLHPEQFDNQRAPQNIKVQCSESFVEFVPATAGQFPLSASRTVVSAVLTDKFHVVAGSTPIPVTPKNGSCMKFKEIEKSLTVEKPVSCNELLGIKGDLAEFCTSTLDRARGGNPKVVQVRDTGKHIDTCASVASPEQPVTPPAPPVPPKKPGSGA